MKLPLRRQVLDTASFDTFREDRRIRLVFLVMFLALSVAILAIFRHYLWPLLFAVVFYIALRPVYDLIHRRIRRQWVCVLITVSLFVLLIVLPLLFLLLALADQTFQFYLFIVEKYDPAAIRRFIYHDGTLHLLLDKLRIDQGDFLRKVMEMLRGFSLDLFSSITGMVSFSLNFLVNFFFMIIILSSIFMEAPKLGRMIYDIVPFPNDVEQTIFRRLKEVIRVLVAGNLAIMVLQGLFVSAGFIIFGVSLPLLAGAAAMIFSLIPVVGTSVVWIPAAVYLIAEGNHLSALLLGSWCLFWYLLLENWVKAKFFGRKLNFHPVVFFLLLIGSIKAFNLPGVILGPVLLSLFFALWEIYHYIYIESGSGYGCDAGKSRLSRRN